MLEKVIKFIEQNRMIQDGDRIAVGISGGADSVCLLFMLLELRQRWDFELLGIHVEHGIRGPQSEEDAKFVKALLKEKGIPERSVSVDVPERARRTGRSLEEAAREARYEVFEQVMQEEDANKVAVAHHQNDQAETVLWNLARGSGPVGMRGMLPVRGRVIRPLLVLGRKEIEQYLRERQISYRTDITNEADDYTRNRIRHHLVPFLEEEVNAGAVSHIAKMAEQMSQLVDFASQEADKAYAGMVRQDEPGLRISLPDLYGLHPYLQATVLRLCIGHCNGSLRNVGSLHTERLLQLGKMPSGSALNLPGRIIAVREHEELYLYREQKRLDYAPGKAASSDRSRQVKRQCLDVTEPGNYQYGEIFLNIAAEPYKSGKITKKIYTKCFDCATIKDRLLVRTRRPGDYLIVNCQGGKKKLKDYLIDQKIPASKRDQIVLLADGSHILWVIGYRVSEASKITEKTKKILKVHVSGGLDDGR